MLDVQKIQSPMRQQSRPQTPQSSRKEASPAPSKKSSHVENRQKIKTPVSKTSKKMSERKSRPESSGSDSGSK